MDGSQARLEVVHRTRIFNRFTPEQGSPRTLIHDVDLEKHSGEWKVVSMRSDVLHKDGSRKPASGLGQAIKQIDRQTEGMLRAAKEAMRY